MHGWPAWLRNRGFRAWHWSQLRGAQQIFSSSWDVGFITQWLCLKNEVHQAVYRWKMPVLRRKMRVLHSFTAKIFDDSPSHVQRIFPRIFRQTHMSIVQNLLSGTSVTSLPHVHPWRNHNPAKCWLVFKKCMVPFSCVKASQWKIDEKCLFLIQ